jgi:hypothetical protein
MGQCIFCEHTETTGEHVFPNWLNDIFPNVPNALMRLGEKTAHDTASVDGDYREWKRLGRKLSSWKVPVACAECNNGWMSRLQTSAQTILADAIDGAVLPLSGAEQREVCKWVVMTAIVAEFTNCDPRARGIPIEDRARLLAICRDNCPVDFPNWWIGIGRYQGRLPMFYDHTFHEIGVDRPFGQSTTIVLGKLLIQSWRTIETRTHTLSEAGCAALGLRKIWPQSGERTLRLSYKFMDDGELQKASSDMRICFERLAKT